MKHTLMLAVSIAALGLSACNKEPDPAVTTAASDAPMVGVTEATPTMVASPSQTFADALAASDTFEIEASKLAATKASSAKVKTFAAQMIQAHTDSTAKLKAAASAASPAITPVPQLTTTQQKALEELSGKTGADFDSAYADAQTEAHEMTLGTLKSYAASGDLPALKTLATQMIPVVTAHLNMAKGL